ncbi:hypothetical protein [Nocardia sp. NPDC056000]|uniref:hypothetical protein n=1 Tax=Nocardia sp. NPDC056000 TaxID=3345674 RepID=UPI0035DDCE71
MNIRNHLPQRLIRPGILVSALLIIAAATTGCGSDHSQPAKAGHTAQSFCAPFLDYFHSGFPIDGVALSYVGGAADQSIDTGVTCAFSQTGAHSGPSLSASVTVRPTKSDEDQNGLQVELKQMNYVLLPGHAKEIWIKDSRVKNGPDQTKGTVELATRIDPWVSGMDIVNNNDTLAITDAQVGAAADVLIQRTEALRQ